MAYTVISLICIMYILGGGGGNLLLVLCSLCKTELNSVWNILFWREKKHIITVTVLLYEMHCPTNVTKLDIIQIYQALRKDSGNYISEEDWHISIFPRGEAPRKNRKIASPPKMCNFHYPFEIKAWYICFISLLYKFNT